jgi:carbonic anhydrase
MRPDGEYARILTQNARFVEAFDRSALTAAPLRGLAILTCMDARIDVEDALGMRVGDAHIIRNAGGLASADAIRSLVVSQQLLGTREIVVIAHTRCGLHRADEAALRQRIEDSTGTATDIGFGAFDDLDAMVREQVGILTAEPALLDVPVHGLVYEVETGRLRAVE